MVVGGAPACVRACVHAPAHPRTHPWQAGRQALLLHDACMQTVARTLGVCRKQRPSQPSPSCSLGGGGLAQLQTPATAWCEGAFQAEPAGMHTRSAPATSLPMLFASRPPTLPPACPPSRLPARRWRARTALPRCLPRCRRAGPRCSTTARWRPAQQPSWATTRECCCWGRCCWAWGWGYVDPGGGGCRACCGRLGCVCVCVLGWPASTRG